MSRELLIFLSKYSLLFPVVVGLLRMRVLDRRYLPFLLMMWTGLLNEVISEISIRVWRTNAPNTNFSFIVEALLLLWLFREWRLFQRRSPWALVLGAGYVGFWFAETFLFRGIQQFSSYFHIFYAFITVLMSVQYINILISGYQKLTVRHSEFLITASFTLYFTLIVLVEMFWVYGFGSKDAFSAQVYLIATVANLISNLIFGFAILWMNRKQNYIALS
ncbi:MAG: hypothetical protein EOO11_08020 [Chitinophagaceae bacterium]|nr:MAG: hypothetical protein EOO11_08020 [Chitinophagaceae bacterium]